MPNKGRMHGRPKKKEKKEERWGEGKRLCCMLGSEDEEEIECVRTELAP